MYRGLVLVMVALVLVGCGLGGSRPEEVAVEVAQALDKQDVATLNELLDDAMPYKDITLLTELREWKSRVRHDPKWDSALGPLVSTEAQPAMEAGASTLVTVLLHHQDGEAALDLTMHKTDKGWRVLAWEIDILSKREAR